MKDSKPQYIVHAPTEEYNGKTLGIKFSAGIAYLSDLTVPEHLGRTLEEVALGLQRDWGYTVEPLTPEARAVLDQWEATRKAAPPAKAGFVRKPPKAVKPKYLRGEGTYQTEEV